MVRKGESGGGGGRVPRRFEALKERAEFQKLLPLWLKLEMHGVMAYLSDESCAQPGQNSLADTAENVVTALKQTSDEPLGPF